MACSIYPNMACSIYPNPVSGAKKDLVDLAWSMGPHLFGDCLEVSGYRSYYLTGSTLHMVDMLELIDDYCGKPGCDIKEYSQICVVRTQFPNFGAFKFFWIEADSDQIFSIISRINKLKVFL
jgi:hypothetical protein